MSICSVAIKLIYLTNLHDECASVDFLHYELSDICFSCSDDRDNGYGRQMRRSKSFC